MRCTEMEVCAGAVRAECNSEGGGKEKRRGGKKEKKKEREGEGRNKERVCALAWSTVGGGVASYGESFMSLFCLKFVHYRDGEWRSFMSFFC